MSAWNEAQSRIVEAAFAAAVDDGLWPDLTEQVIAATRTRGSFLGVLDHTTGDAVHCILTHATAQGYEEYVGGMAQFDPQGRMVAHVGQGSVYTDRDHVDWDSPVSSDYMKWQYDRLGWHSHVTIASKLDDRHAYGMSFHLGRDEASRTEEVKQFLSPIAGALSQALQLGFIHNNKLTDEYWLGASANIDPLAAFLLGEGGRVLRMNERAERLVTAGQPLTLQAGRLRSPLVREQARIESMVEAATTPLSPMPGAALLRGSTDKRWFVRISPIVRKRRIMVIDEPAALVTIRLLESMNRAQKALWQQLFSLTATEARVADQLRKGLPADAIAARLDMKVATVRTHTKMIHDKTETRRNAELAHLLTLLAGQ
jgi:DNA-binding CsgD family transcriptional regulator